MCSHHSGYLPLRRDTRQRAKGLPTKQRSEVKETFSSHLSVAQPSKPLTTQPTSLLDLLPRVNKRHAPSGLPAPPLWTGVDFSGCYDLDRVFEPWISPFLLFLTSCGKVSPRTLENSCTLSLYLGGPTFTVAPKLFPKPRSFSVPWVTDAFLAPSLFLRRHREENKFW